MPSLSLSFYIGAGLSFIAALLCAMRGEKFVEEIDGATRNDGGVIDAQEVSGESIKEELPLEEDHQGGSNDD